MGRKMPSNKRLCPHYKEFCVHPECRDPHESCRRIIDVLERQLQKHDFPEIAQVVIQEGDQNGVWDRVLNVVDVQRTPEGLVIRVI